MDVEVGMGELAVKNGSGNMIASAVGSCLVITLYDSRQRIGAMAHAMLSDRRPSSVVRRPRTQEDGIRNTDDGIRDTKYVGAAIDEMMTQMLERGARREDLEAKLIGGANMFGHSVDGPGAANVTSAKAKFKQEQIKLAGEIIGGSIGRSVEFAVDSGIVTVKSKF